MTKSDFLVGQVVYLEPTGNNIRLNNADLRTATVKEVKSKYVYVDINTFLEPFEIQTGLSKPNNNNAGWKLWLSREDFERQKLSDSRIFEIRRFFHHGLNQLNQLTHEDIDKIYEILFGKEKLHGEENP